MDIESKKLSNGLNTVFVHSPGCRAASVQIWFRAGSALEKGEDLGIAHFLEHMFFKGTPTRPGHMVADAVEKLGGEINAFTSFDYTCYYINSPYKHIKQSLDILLDMVANPEFKDSEIPPEREVVLEEYKRSLDSPVQYAFFELQKKAFTGDYSHPILGTPETINSFTREQLINFRKDYYNLSNSFLVVAGDLDHKEEFEELINTYNLPTGKTSEFPEFEIASKPSINVHKKDVRQALLTLTVQAPNLLEAKAAHEDLAINCLSHGETSILHKTLVLEDSLASSVGGSTMFFRDGGCHFIRVAAPIENLPKIYKRLNKIIKEALETGLNPQDIKKIKNQYVASKIYEKESIESFSFALGHSYASCNDLFAEDHFIERIKKATSGEVNSAFKEILKNPLHASIQIPRESDERKHEAQLRKFLEDFKKTGRTKSKKINIKSKGSKFDDQVKIFELKKGIKLIYRRNTQTPTFVFHTYMKGGLTEEKSKTSGTYNLLSSLLTKGYQKNSFEQIKRDLEERSASLSGFSGKNAYGLTLHGQTDHAKILLKHFFGSLLTPKIPTNLLKHEKELIQRALENQQEDPVKRCFKAFNEVIFLKHPYSFNTIGSPESIKKLNRKFLLETHQKNINKKEVLFTYCGDLEIEDVLELINPYIDDLKSRTPRKTTLKKVDQLNGQSINIELDREQSHIFIGKPGFKLNSKSEVYLKILSAHLSGQSSDLFVEVRDRQGLCYSVQPVNFSALEAGYWGIYIATSSEKTERAITAIEQLLLKLSQTGFNKDEFEKVKLSIEGQTQLSLQTNDDYANLYSIPELHNIGIDYYHKSNELIQKTKLEDFNRFIKKFLATKWNHVIVGP